MSGPDDVVWRSPLAHRIELGIGWLLAGIETIAALGLFVLEATWRPEHPAHVDWLVRADAVVLVAFALRAVSRLLRRVTLRREAPRLVFVVAVGAVGLASLRLAAAIALVHDGAELWRAYHRRTRGDPVLVDAGHRPARTLVLSFLALIGVGTVLLVFPAAWGGSRVGWLDAFFTAVSATCVTGLITVDTATAWSSFGQGVILVLIQLGGLGIMAVSAAMTLALGRRIGLEEDAALRGAFDESDAEELRALLKSLVLSTFVIEGIGAIVLFARFAPSEPIPRAIFDGVFHSVSAFCNAGFSLNSDSLVRYAADPVVSGMVMVLITIGGFGFGVLVSLWRYFRSRGRAPLPVHAKVVLLSSAALVWLGAVAYFYFEYNRSLAHLSLFGKVIAALFQSVTTRTAGFNSVSFDLLHPATLLVMMTLMIIGASPGSTGGGIKTTTFALVLLAARSYLRDRNDVEVMGRRVAPSQVMRALAVSGGATLAFFFGLGLLLVTESQSFVPLMFETASALGTVGLSLGVTPQLTVAGRLVIILLMFAGRVGPLTIASAAATRSASARVTLPEGKVLIG